MGFSSDPLQGLKKNHSFIELVPPRCDFGLLLLPHLLLEGIPYGVLPLVVMNYASNTEGEKEVRDRVWWSSQSLGCSRCHQNGVYLTCVK